MVATIGSAKKLTVKSSANKKSTKSCSKHVCKPSTKSKKKTSTEKQTNQVQKVLIHPLTQNKIFVTVPDENNNNNSSNTNDTDDLTNFTLKLPTKRVPKKKPLNLYEKLKNSYVAKSTYQVSLQLDESLDNILDDF